MKPHTSEWLKGSGKDMPLLPSLGLVLLGVFAAFAFQTALQKNVPAPVTPQVFSVAEMASLETYCYAYGGLYGLSTFWNDDNGQCFQSYKGDYYPVAYKELLITMQK